MNLKKVLTSDLICAALQGESKQTIIEDLRVAKGQVRARKTALKALLEREAKMSTGLQHGMALPHAQTDAVDRMVGAIGIRREGIDFESIDGEPSTIFIVPLSPLSRPGPHIQFLSEIGQLLAEEPLRDHIRNAKSAEDVLAVINS